MRGVYDTKFAWTPEAVACLTKRRGDGWSSTQIAKELAETFKSPVTRSAVIGKAYRLGLEMPAERRRVTVALSQPKKPTADKVVKPRADAAASQRRVVQLMADAKAEAAAKVVLLRTVEDSDLIATAPCCILDLTSNSCRWPLKRTAENGETLFCANEKAETGAYCPGHARRAYSRVISKDQRDAEKQRVERHRDEARAAGRRESLFGFGLAKRFA